MITLRKEFITPEEEAELISKFNFPPKITAGRNGIVRFGSKVPYANYHESTKIPNYLKALTDLITCTSVTINKYEIGRDILPHIDLGKGMISVLSLGGESDIIFQKGEEVKSLILPPRSLLEFDEEERYEWTHSIPPVKSLRYSIVFR